MIKRINWRSPKTWLVIVALNVVCSPTVWVLAIGSVRSVFAPAQ